MGKGLKALLKKTITTKMIIIIIIIAAIAVIILPADDQIVLDEGAYKDNDKSNAPYVVGSTLEANMTESSGENGEIKQLKTALAADGGYKIDINLDEITDNIIETLDTNGGNLDNYIIKGNQKELIKKLVKAELITQYPDLRSASKIGTPVSDETEFQGAIKFVRHKSDNTQTTLEYIPLGNASDTGSGTLYGLINQANGTAGGDATSARSKVLNHFSLDTEGNLIVAIYNETVTKAVNGSYDTEYKTSEEEVNYSSTDRTYLDSAVGQVTYKYEAKELQYKSAISGYAMPFEYLWAFLVCGKDEHFVSDVADLVLETNIEVSIYDSLTINESATMSVYNTNDWKREKIDQRQTVGEEEPVITEGQWGEPQITAKHNYDIIYRKDYYNSISVLAVTKADVWYMTQTVSYTYEAEQPTNPGLSNWQTTRESEKDEEFDNPDSVDIPTIIGEWIITSTDSVNSITYEQRTCTQTQTKNNQFAVYSADNTEKYKYTANGNPVVDESKLDNSIKEGEVGYPNFCTLYLKSDSARNNITDYGGIGLSRLCTVLESNETTVNMVDLTKYILYKATEKDYGVTTFDFTIFNEQDFTKTGQSGEDLLLEYIHMWENAGGAPTNADGTKYIVHSDGSNANGGAGNPTVGYGVDIYHSGYLETFIAAGYSTEIGAEIDVEFVDAIKEQIIEDKIAGTEERLNGLDLTGYQKNALISRAYQCGTAGALDTIRNGKNFVQAYQAYWTEEDDLFEEKNSNADFNHMLYTTYMDEPTTSGGEFVQGIKNRRESEWRLFQTGYYDVLDKWHLSAGDFSVETVEAAGYIFPHYFQNDYPGRYGTSTIPKSGCGPTSLAMVLAGLKGDPSIDPISVVSNLEDHWPSGKYYIEGQGSSHCIFSNEFLTKYYGVTSISSPSEKEAIEALENGCAAIGSEERTYFSCYTSTS